MKKSNLYVLRFLILTLFFYYKKDSLPNNELRRYVHPTMKSVEIDPNPVNANEPKISLDEFFKWKD